MFKRSNRNSSTLSTAAIFLVCASLLAGCAGKPQQSPEVTAEAQNQDSASSDALPAEEPATAGANQFWGYPASWGPEHHTLPKGQLLYTILKVGVDGTVRSGNFNAVDISEAEMLAWLESLSFDTPQAPKFSTRSGEQASKVVVTGSFLSGSDTSGTADSIETLESWLNVLPLDSDPAIYLYAGLSYAVREDGQEQSPPRFSFILKDDTDATPLIEALEATPGWRVQWPAAGDRTISAENENFIINVLKANPSNPSRRDEITIIAKNWNIAGLTDIVP